EITQHSQPKPGFAEQAADIARPGAAAAGFTDVPTRADADEIVAGGKATQEISPQHTAGGLKPVGGLQMFDPRHEDSHFLLVCGSLRRAGCGMKQKYHRIDVFLTHENPTRPKRPTRPRQQATPVLAFFRQGPWNVDLRTPPGPEGSNGSLLRICRGHPGISSIFSFQF